MANGCILREAYTPQSEVHALIRIALADDHAIVREGFRALIEREPDMMIVAECASGIEAEMAVTQTKPDVLVLDLSMRGGSGLEVLPRLRARFPALCVLVMSMHDGEPYVGEALGCGARGYVTKAAAPAELTIGIRALMAGQRYLSADLALREPATAAPGIGTLSAREREVFLLLARGFSPKQVAGDLGISVKTAYVHRANVMAKLAARNDRDLYRIALGAGLLGG